MKTINRIKQIMIKLKIVITQITIGRGKGLGGGEKGESNKSNIHQRWPIVEQHSVQGDS